MGQTITQAGMARNKHTDPMCKDSFPTPICGNPCFPNRGGSASHFHVHTRDFYMGIALSSGPRGAIPLLPAPRQHTEQSSSARAIPLHPRFTWKEDDDVCLRETRTVVACRCTPVGRTKADTTSMSAARRGLYILPGAEPDDLSGSNDPSFGSLELDEFHDAAAPRQPCGESPASSINVLSTSSGFFTERSMARSRWSSRYTNPDVEADYLVFSHESPYPRCVLVAAFLLIRALLYLGNTVVPDKSYVEIGIVKTVASVALLAFAALGVLLSLESVTRRLPSRIRSVFTVRRRALLAEYVVTAIGLALRLSDVSSERAEVHLATPDGTVSRSLLNERSGSLIWYFTFVPPRFVMAIPCMVALTAVHVATVVVKSPSDISDICGATLLPYEFLVALAMLSCWDRSRRANFDARTALALQSHRGARLIATLETELQACSAATESHRLAFEGLGDCHPSGSEGEASTTTVSAGSSGDHATSSNSDVGARTSTRPVHATTRPPPRGERTALVMVVRASLGTLAVKHRLLEVVAGVAASTGGLSPGAVLRPFSSSGDVICLVAPEAVGCEAQGQSSISIAAVACATARLLHREMAAWRPPSDECAESEVAPGNSLDESPAVHLRIGIHSGVLWSTADATPLTQVAGVPGAVSSLPFALFGPALRVALRLSELTLPGTSLISDVLFTEAAGVYALTRLHDTVVEGRRMQLHLVGMPWCDRGLHLEAAARRQLRSRRAGQRPAFITGSGGHTDDIPTLLATKRMDELGTEKFNQMLDADKMLVEFRWSWLFGWYFVDAEVEDEFRSQECRGIHRFVPVVACVVSAITCGAWQLSGGTGPMNHWTWLALAAVLVGCVFLAIVARPEALGQSRLLVLWCAVRLLIVAPLALALYSLHDYSNPMQIYQVEFTSMIFSSTIIWVPSIAPSVLIIFVELATLTCSSRDTRLSPFLWIAVTFTSLLRILVVRQRNRWLLADVVAARRCYERWRSARGELCDQFARLLPFSVALRLVEIGTRAVIPNASPSASFEASKLSKITPLPSARYALHLSETVVLAVQLDVPPAKLHAANAAADELEEAAITLAVAAALSDFSAIHSGMSLFTTGDVWLVVSVDDSQPLDSRRSLLLALVDTIGSNDVLRRSGYHACVGLATGCADGDLCGDNGARHYEITGDAVIRALKQLVRGGEDDDDDDYDTDSGGEDAGASDVRTLPLYHDNRFAVTAPPLSPR
jgi:hypothetical protein